jgi:putative hydrolase
MRESVMIDLHTHTLWSDGELVPAEHIRRAFVAGYEAVAITDHADSSNIEELCREAVKFAADMKRLQKDILVLSGVEITHVLSGEIAELTEFARGKGIQIVAVHGETPVEPVRSGTNMAAILAGVDILAHPGFITEEEVKLSVQKGVCLEITARKGHSLTNGHVAKLAQIHRAKLVIDTDAHSHNDFIPRDFARKVLLGSGLPETMVEGAFENSRILVQKLRK